MKPTNSPTQGQPNLRKIRLKEAFGRRFPTASIFSWVGIDFMEGTDYKKPNATKILREHPDTHSASFFGSLCRRSR